MARRKRFYPWVSLLFLLYLSDHSSLPAIRMIEMAIGIMVGCMPAVAALVRKRDLPFSNAFSSLHTIFKSSHVSVWLWLERRLRGTSSCDHKKTTSKIRDSALREQQRRSPNWESDGYFERMEAQEPRN